MYKLKMLDVCENRDAVSRLLEKKPLNRNRIVVVCNKGKIHRVDEILNDTASVQYPVTVLKTKLVITTPPLIFKIKYSNPDNPELESMDVTLKNLKADVLFLDVKDFILKISSDKYRDKIIKKINKIISPRKVASIEEVVYPPIPNYFGCTSTFTKYLTKDTQDTLKRFSKRDFMLYI